MATIKASNFALILPAFINGRLAWSMTIFIGIEFAGRRTLKINPFLVTINGR
jgi:hypothetical protein